MTESTAEMQNSSIEKLNINWSVFADSEAAKIRIFINTGHYEDLAAVIWDVSPEKAEEIAKIQAQLRPRSFQFVSQIQKEFDLWMDQRRGACTPEEEKEWQDKMDKERSDALAAISGGSTFKVDTQGKTGSANVSLSNDLHEVDGLGQASIDKLAAVGIYNVEGLRKLPHAERVKILNPLVAGKIKNLQ